MYRAARRPPRGRPSIDRKEWQFNEGGQGASPCYTRTQPKGAREPDQWHAKTPCPGQPGRVIYWLFPLLLLACVVGTLLTYCPF